jgi:hypothetical protein
MMDIDTPRTEQVHALINNCGGSTEAAFHDMLNHARQMERERNEWAERWADLNRAAVRESVALEEAKNVLRIVLNGGIDDGLDWQQVMDKVRDIVKPNRDMRKGPIIKAQA